MLNYVMRMSLQQEILNGDKSVIKSKIGDKTAIKVAINTENGDKRGDEK